MQPQKHTSWSATAAIAAALALTSTPLAAQDAATPITEPPAAPPVEPAPTVVASPAPTVVASPAPTVEIPDVTAPAASGAGDAEPAPEPSATVKKTTTKTTIAPAARTTTHTTVTRTTVPAVVAPVAAVPPPANDAAPPTTETIDAAPAAVAPTIAPEPTPTQSSNVVGTLGLVLLGLLALAILAAGLLFFRRRHPIVTETIEDPLARRPVAEPPIAEPAVAVAPMAAPTLLHRREPNPVAGALPSDGAAVDLPAKLPESYEERNALFERMVNARPDKANPFTDRRQRMKRARLIMQSLGVTFDHEPRIDLSQYPNNWPELRRQYHKAA
jgi:hypothetical protein